MSHRIGGEMDGKGMLISFTGTVPGQELIALNGQLNADECISRLRYQIWDFFRRRKTGDKARSDPRPFAAGFECIQQQSAS